MQSVANIDILTLGTGKYYATTCTNLPAGWVAAYLDVERLDSQWCRITAWPPYKGLDTPYITKQSEGAWQGWKTILTNADLTDTIADLKVEANKGISARRIVQCDTNTLNTPFKAGLTNGASGTAFICMSSSSFGTILYIVSGSDKMFMLCKTNGTWGSWIAK